MNREYIPLQDAARLEGVPYKTLLQRYRRLGVVLIPDPHDARRKLVPITALTPKTLQAWLGEQTVQILSQQAPTTAMALAPASQSHLTTTNRADDTQAGALAHRADLAQPGLPFQPLSKYDESIHAAVPVAVPKAQQVYLEKHLAIIGQCLNGNYRNYLGELWEGFMINGPDDFVRALGHINRVSARSIYRKVAIARPVFRDQSLTMGDRWKRICQSLMPKPRPGLRGKGFWDDPENAWLAVRTRELYLNQARLSIPRTLDLILYEIEMKQRAHGLNHLYPRPTEWHVRYLIEQITEAEKTLFRQGEKAYRDKCAPYISRRRPECSNDVWTTDQKYLDILMRDGAWRTGRIWTVNFLDVTSQVWLGGACGPTMSSDLVMEAAAMALSRAGRPKAVQMDLGGEFIGDRFLGGQIRISKEALFEDALGLWQRLGVTPLKAIGRNPQTKPIERWHGCLRTFEQQWPTWCAGNTKDRPPILAQYERQRDLFLQGKAPAPPFPRILDVIRGFYHWCEFDWNMKHRGKGKYLEGMTPFEAWNARQPEGGIHPMPPEEVAFYTAERRVGKVGRGGQINIQMHGRNLEYEAPELMMQVGEQIEILINRLSHRQVTVIYAVPGGTRACVANLKRQAEWNNPEDRDEVKVRLRCRAALETAYKRSVQRADAARDLLNASDTMTLPALAAEATAKHVINVKHFFGIPAAEPDVFVPPRPAITAERANRPRRTFTSEEVAKRMLEIQEGDGA